ncbi:malate dehydrogenase, partial [Kouleothrix aurantiaca]
MKPYRVVRDPRSGETTLETTLGGAMLLECPMINKGSAFTDDERRELGLLGLLPPHVASIEEQLARTYENYRQKSSAQERHVFLTSLQDRNEALFFRLLSEHLPEMLPMVYAPVIGITARHYSHSYRRPRGLY